MLELVVIALTAFAAALLTFFSGFGLGTLLMPVVALFFAIDVAIAITAIVHLANNLFKVGLVGRYAHWPTLLRFGVPALLFAFAGALFLETLAVREPLAIYELGGIDARITWVKVVVGGLILAFVAVELLPAVKARAFPASWMPVGGALSGFLGGLSGHQGALRSMFLVKAGLSGTAYLGTGILIAVLVDVARLTVYGATGLKAGIAWTPVAVTVAAAFCGSYVASRFINKVTIGGIQTLVSILLVAIAIGLISGMI